jgi:hypothetical protein
MIWKGDKLESRIRIRIGTKTLPFRNTAFDKPEKGGAMK